RVHALPSNAGSVSDKKPHETQIATTRGAAQWGFVVTLRIGIGAGGKKNACDRIVSFLSGNAQRSSIELIPRSKVDALWIFQKNRANYGLIAFLDGVEKIRARLGRDRH